MDSNGYDEVSYNQVDEVCEANDRVKRKRWYHDVADFANLLKSFIGTNYLSLAYGILQSGLVLGIIGLVLVAAMTTHCCRLIVKVKYHAVRKLISRRSSMHESIPSFDGEDDKKTFQHLQKTITYSDIGGIAFGKVGIFLVNTFLVITQVGFCISYYIFIGSNIHSLLVGDDPSKNSSSLFNGTNVTFPPLDSIYDFAKNGSITTPDLLSTTSVYLSTTTSPQHDQGPWIPPLFLLVSLPLPIFIVFTLIRRIRLMGPISLAANGMMSAGYFLVLAYMIANFELAPNLQLVKWATFPVFLGQAAASYEAIGTILSIEASMEGNHRRYPACLYSVVLVFSAMLTASAIIGYLMYGEDTKQILVQNLPQASVLNVVVNITLIIAILFTYPLQVFPIVEILEGVIFGQAMTNDINEKSHLLSDASSGKEESSKSYGHVVTTIPDSVATWKRNVLRVSISLFIGVLAVLLKDVFAYVSAFVGALGSCPLAFILPCLFHIKICGRDLATGVIVKDVCLIVVGSIMSVVSVVVVVMEAVQKLTV